MELTVGIPRALLYHKYHPLWTTFLGELGVNMTLSAPTNRRLIARSSELAENELCVPVKAFYGHAEELAGQADLLFIPRMVSVEKGAFTCPKFLGLPDMIQALDIDVPILSPVFDARRGRVFFYRQMHEMAHALRLPLRRVLGAWRSAERAQAAHEASQRASAGERNGGRKVGVAGHPYNIYDPYLSMGLIDRLERRGIKTLVPESLTPEQIDRGLDKLPKQMFWSYEKDVIGSVFHWLQDGDVDGIIYVLSFACGPDSIVQVLLESEARQVGGTPLMPLVIDEHSAEAGLLTRIEAFADMLERRPRVMPS